MDVFHTPLLECFRRDDVARDVRLSAAQGTIAPRPIEQLALLMLLCGDRDEEVQRTAEATLAGIPPDSIAAVIARVDAPGELRAFFEQRGITPAEAPHAVDVPLVDEDTTDYGTEPKTESEKLSMLQQLSLMTVPQKVKAAMKGTREMRAVLIRDPNKLISLSVLSSPKLTETEVEAFARTGSIAEDVIRTIARTRTWMKHYGVVHALAKNAKTPVAISMPLLSRLTEADVKRLSTDRNVPEPLRIAARRRIVENR